MSPTHIISGGARGVDRLAGEYAASNGIEFTEYLADWDKYGKRAGFMRNCVMVGTADAVIAVWDGKSPGTKHSIDYATSQGKQVFVLRPEINKAAGREQPNAEKVSIKRISGKQASAFSELKDSRFYQKERQKNGSEYLDHRKSRKGTGNEGQRERNADGKFLNRLEHFQEYIGGQGAED